MNDIKNLEISDILLQISKLDYSKILQHIPSVITFFATSAIIKNYNLRKDFKPKKNVKVFLPPELTLKYSDIYEEQLLSSELKNYILKFVNTIAEKVPSSNLVNLYNNLNELKIRKSKFKLFNFILKKNTVGAYSPKKNIIYFNNKYIDSIYHELFHLSSSTFQNNVSYAGFSQNGGCNALHIGDGLNEGYTELLVKRYFGNVLSIWNFSYPIERYFISNLETIIGQEKMEELYFNANLQGLIDELKQYESEENIIDFIRGVDFFNTHMYAKGLILGRNKLIIKKMKSLNKFLISCYTKKIIKEFYDGLLDEKAFVEKAKNYLSDIGDCVWLGNKSIKFFLEDDLVDILNNIFNEMKVRGNASMVRKQ